MNEIPIVCASIILILLIVTIGSCVVTVNNSANTAVKEMVAHGADSMRAACSVQSFIDSNRHVCTIIVSGKEEAK